MPWEEQKDSRKQLPDLKPKGWNYLEDDDEMPFGVHKGKKMKEVPASYLRWLYNDGCKNKSVLNYIVRNRERLQTNT